LIAASLMVVGGGRRTRVPRRRIRRVAGLGEELPGPGRIQQLVHDKAMYAPIWELGFIHAQGPRVAESGLGLINRLGVLGPYEDVRLKSR